MSKVYVITICVITFLLVLVGIMFAKRGSSNISPTSNQIKEVNSQTSTGISDTPQQSPSPVVADVPSVTVTYTNGGFTPEGITINKGDTVKFVNSSSSSMWVASEPHPVHTAYPGFDAKRGYRAGDSYNFTFTQAGDWSYHNHLDPTLAGKVIVK